MITTREMRTAMRKAAAAHNLVLTDTAADAIATAALTHTDTKLGTRQEISHAAWDHHVQRAGVRKNMLEQLSAQVFTDGRLPTALPAERLTYWAGFGPDAVMVREAAEWTYVLVELSVPTRKAAA